MASKILIFVPTYNEADNAPRMCAEIAKLDLPADVLFVDDNSPDQTGTLLEQLRPQFPRLIVHHRSGKLGIGSAHFDGIGWAYDHGYDLLVTLDCDFTHSPSDIPKLIAAAEHADVVVGSRWLSKNSLPGWNPLRRLLTKLGHLLTRNVLGVPQDASGAFRAYRLDRVPREIFQLVKSRGYSFFFESLFVLNKNGLAVAEIPIVLPARTYGHSKMDFSAAFRSARYIFELYLSDLRRPEQFLLEHKAPELDAKLSDPQGWDSYWDTKGDAAGLVYELIAGLYRRLIIKPNLERAVRRVFTTQAKLLHAGCGSGQVDTELQRFARITALDISPAALRLYARNNPGAAAIEHGSIFSLPFPDASFDGIYNLGVMEHFTTEEIHRILAEFHRVLRAGGKLLLFWPMASAPSVAVLGMAHRILRLFKRTKALHPPEVSLLRSRGQAEELLRASRFIPESFYFGWRDLRTQAVIAAVKGDNLPGGHIAAV
jgi:dolichol-phosphate mannosyltransferase